MLVTEFGMVIEVRPVQPPNPLREITELGMVTEVRPVQPPNAAHSMDVTELGIVKDVMPVQPSNVLFSMVVMVLGMDMEEKLTHSEKAYSPIEVTELGMTKLPVNLAR